MLGLGLDTTAYKKTQAMVLHSDLTSTARYTLLILVPPLLALLAALGAMVLVILLYRADGSNPARLKPGLLPSAHILLFVS